jgi:hypothetical protein
LVLVRQKVVGDAILSVEFRPVKLIELVAEPLELRVILVALLDADGGELVRVVVEDRAVDDADLGKGLRISNQKLDGLPVGEHVERERCAPDRPVCAVAKHDQTYQTEPACNAPEFLHGGAPQLLSRVIHAI